MRLGNPSLKPAFSREVEYGLNAGFLKKFTLEYSYSNKLTKDQILDVPLSLVTGYSSQWRNAGTLQGDSHEIALGALLFATTTYSWKLNVVGDRTRSRIVDLNVQPFLSGPPGSTKYFRVAKGETFGVIYGERFIRTASQLARSIASGTLAGVATDYVRNEDGFYVAAATKGTLGERPLVDYPTTGSANQQIGDVNPDFNLSLNNSVQWRHLSVHALVNWVQGGNIYNLTRQSTFAGLRNVVVDQRGKPQAAKKPTSYYASFFNLGVPTDYFVEDGSYIRLRELSANVQLPKRWTRRFLANKSRTARFGIVGRNLWTATKYSGYDPDVTAKGGASGGGDQPFSYRVDGATHYPSYRTLTLVIDIGN